MTIFHLGMTLSVVGPRAKLLTLPRWPMALRLTVGTADPVDPESVAALIPDTFPWKIWTSPQVDVTAMNDVGTVTTSTCQTEAPLSEDAAFVDALKQAIEANGIRLADSKMLDMTFNPAMVNVEDTDSQHMAVSWPGLLKTVSSLAPPTPSALLCTWYFWLDRETVASEIDGTWSVKKNLLLSAVPSEFRGAVRESFVSQTGPGKYPVHVHGYKGGTAVAFCEALDIGAVLDHQLDEMDNFWLTIRDSSDDSLLDLSPRIEQALNPTSMLGCLQLEDLIHSTFATRPQSGGASEPTPSEMARAIEAWKSALSTSSASDLRKRKDAILLAASTATDGQAEAARQAYIVQVESIFNGLGPTTLDDGVVVEFKSTGELAAKVEANLLPPPGSQLKPVSPAEGIELLIGDESLRLRHDSAQEHSAVDDVAQIQVFGRRSSDLALLDPTDGRPGAPWHPLTAARYLVQREDKDAKVVPSTERVMGVTATYQENVLYRELHYVGANMVSINPLAQVHREGLADDPLESFMLARIEREASTTTGMRSVALRYGDWYEFAASIVDRAGGIADELTTGAPWSFDPSRIAGLQPPQRTVVRYLRNVPVGDLNLIPAVGSSWPQTPQGVSLRCREQGAPDGDGPAPAPLFLVPDGEAFITPTLIARPPASYRFLVGAPQSDEHTLLRWLMPATTLDDETRKQEAQELKKTLARIYQRRDDLLAAQALAVQPDASLVPAAWPQVLEDDPAVGAIGVRWTYDDGSSDSTILMLEGKPLAIEVTTSKQGATDPTVKKTLPLNAGQFVCIRMYALVAAVDLDRFDVATLEAHLEADHPWTGYGAFDETTVWVEAASDSLPQVDQKLLSLAQDQRGAIQLSYDLHQVQQTERSLHDNVIQTRIASDRWIWRNLPLPPEEGFKGDSTELRRRLASGPPRQLLDDKLRDSDPAVDVFDKLSAIDGGFVGREDKHVDYPRDTKDRALLLVDDRDGHAQAEYLRYSVSFRSRYAPVLAKPNTEWSSKRRIAAGFRGNVSLIKPPKVLAVLPLTQALTAPILPASSVGATPFLVVLDDVWFREYGLGERLEARISFVKPEIPETAATAPTQRRFGPLPDHHLAPIDLKGLDEPLTCFGPFGLSLDRDGSQALANATAFVVYPPAGTPPHFNLFVEFARVLDLPTLPSGSISPRSEYGEAYPFYTLADSATLAFGSEKEAAIVRVRPDGLELSGGAQLVPFDGANDSVMGQYRYLMIVGQHVRDGGRGVDVFLPQDALWISSNDGKNSRARWVGASPTRTFTAAVVVEILLNGRFDSSGPHPLSDQRTLRDLLLAMLADAEPDARTDFPEDAPGMIRRVSPWFPIATQT